MALSPPTSLNSNITSHPGHLCASAILTAAFANNNNNNYYYNIFFFSFNIFHSFNNNSYNHFPHPPPQPKRTAPCFQGTVFLGSF